MWATHSYTLQQRVTNAALRVRACWASFYASFAASTNDSYEDRVGRLGVSLRSLASFTCFVHLEARSHARPGFRTPQRSTAVAAAGSGAG
jgi:hypothetical protein